MYVNQIKLEAQKLFVRNCCKVIQFSGDSAKTKAVEKWTKWTNFLINFFTFRECILADMEFNDK